jgi:hypothetical protein
MSLLLTKNAGVPLDIKAVGDDGTFEGYGSIFGNVDSYGEAVDAGCLHPVACRQQAQGHDRQDALAA